MIRRVEPAIDPDAAVTCGLPIANAVASPELLIVVKVVSEEVQATEDVMFAVLPSLNVPIAANCSVDPATTDGLAGVTWMEISVFVGGGGGED